MATLDKVMQLQSKGMSNADIINQLKNEGISPVEINDAINQAQIKNAVSPPENMNNEQQEINPNTQNPMPEQTQNPEIYPPQNQYETTQEQMPQSNQEYQDQYAQQNQQAYQDQYAQGQYPYEQQPQPEYEDYYQQTPQSYSNQNSYGNGSGTVSTETISEIAEQVVTEKLGEYKKKVGDVASFNNTIQDKVNDIDDRLKRIEGTIDKLQQAIIGKIGEFGESNAMIHKDLENLHGTVGKLMNPLVDTYNELKKKH